MDRSRTDAFMQLRLAIAGPSGSGKSTVVRLLTENNPERACVQEPEPPEEIKGASILRLEAAVRFQESISLSRRNKALSNRSARVLIFDRSFAEDREVFLPLYRQLGYLRSDQVAQLRMVSFESEAAVGRPHSVVILTAPVEVLRNRVAADSVRRPRWLLEHLELQCDLYSAWSATLPKDQLFVDTSSVQADYVKAVVERHLSNELERLA